MTNRYHNKFLGLLDDASPMNGDKKDDELLNQVTSSELQSSIKQNELAAQAAQKEHSRKQNINKQLKNAKPSPLVQTTKGGTRIFRNTKTFKQLLSEYNGRKNSLNLLKNSPLNAPTRTSKPARPGDFGFDSVEVMELPEIPGKIIRPV